MKAERSIVPSQVLLIASICMAIGCGEGHPPAYPVTGQVVFADGGTLQYGGQVLFISTNVKPQVKAYGNFGQDGKFELTTYTEGDGAVAGHYKVAVIPNFPEDHEDAIVSEREYAKAMQPIDDRFRDPGRSGIEFDVSAETSPHDFRIEVTEPRRRR